MVLQRKLSSRREVAEALGISRQRVEKLIRDGRIVETAAGIDIEAARTAYLQTIDPAKRQAYEARTSAGPRAQYGRRGADEITDAESGEVLNFATARTQKEAANAKRAALEYQIRAGNYVARDEVRAREFEIARKLRDRILGFPARLASVVPSDAMAAITAECHDLIRELQDDAATIAETGRTAG